MTRLSTEQLSEMRARHVHEEHEIVYTDCGSDIPKLLTALEEAYSEIDRLTTAYQVTTVDLVTAESKLKEARADIALVRGCMDAQDEREREAAKKCGMVHNCDWPDDAAEKILELRALIEKKDEALRKSISIMNECSADYNHRNFTDRYGGNPTSWLRGCFADCEAMGYFPLCNPDKQTGSVRLNTTLTPRDLMVWNKAHDAAGDHECDGWHFVKCEVCGGSGRCSWLETFTRIPKWIIKGMKFLYQSPTMGNKRTWRDITLAFKCAFLSDLGLWRP